MEKYIKAEALIDDLRDLAEANKGTYHEEGFKNAITVVEMQPTADVVERKDLDEITKAHEQIGYEKGYRDGYAQAKVEVVRCKDCKWFNEIGCAIRIDDESDKPKEDDFCSFGERREA